MWAWVGFLLLVVSLLVIDLKVVMGEEETLDSRKAAWYSGAWIGIGLVFTLLIGAWLGEGAAGEYITGYLIEKSLSMDNVFVWALLFSYFRVPGNLQHRVLFWGVFGALAMRAGFIFAGVALLNTIHWIFYLFGGFLLWTAWRLFRADEDEMGVDPEHNPVLRRVRERLPHTTDYRGHRFFVRENGRTLATPLFTVLLTIELTDVVFAADSIPAILAVTRHEFIVFSSNAFAILGLRALYFLLADVKDRFVYLDKGLAVVLGFMGIKFLTEEWIEIPTWISLAVVISVLAAAIWISWRRAPEAVRGD